MNEAISKLTSLEQSLWYDNIQRKILENGEFKAMIVPLVDFACVPFNE
ncbi:MAG: hypothetical protein U0X92_13965 [Anaerolineales bacterium]